MPCAETPKYLAYINPVTSFAQCRLGLPYPAQKCNKKHQIVREKKIKKIFGLTMPPPDSE